MGPQEGRGDVSLLLTPHHGGSQAGTADVGPQDHDQGRGTIQHPLQVLYRIQVL
jgi:hypothetical protein